jgi:hypothetical protein
VILHRWIKCGSHRDKSVFESMEQPPRPDPTLLAKCCLIHDNIINDEKTEEKDIPLFFYPRDTDIRRQVQVIQSCMAISSLASSCSATPVCPCNPWFFTVNSSGFCCIYQTSQISLQTRRRIHYGMYYVISPFGLVLIRRS